MSRTEKLALVLVGATFLAAGLLKIADPYGFAVSIARLRLVPSAWVGPAAILLPWMEVVSAAALLAPGFRRPALYLELALLAGFTLVLAAALIRGTGGSCGCFGTGDGFFSRTDTALARNAAMLALIGWLLRRKPADASTCPASPASPA